MAAVTLVDWVGIYAEFTIDGYVTWKMKLINTGGTEYPTGAGATGAQTIADAWDYSGGQIQGTISELFTATGNWGTIDSVKLWFNSDADTVELPISVSRALLVNYTLTIDFIQINLASV